MSENSESTDENAWCDSEFWNVNCLFSLIVLPNLVLWLLVCIPMCVYIRNEDKHKKWWWNLLHIRYFLMWIIIISMVISEFTWSTVQSCQCKCYSCFMRISVYLFIFILWYWFLYNHESKYKVEYQYFENVYKLSQAQEYLSKLNEAQPRITFIAQNYRMETMENDNGEYQERRNTVRYDETLLYNHKPLEELQILNIDGVTRVRLIKGFVFDSEELKSEHYARYSEFKARSRNVNELMDAEEVIHIPDFCDRILVIPESSDVPFWMNKTWFWTATFFFLSMPYQLLFKLRTKKLKYHIEKNIVSVDS